uniref:SUI1 domain-containing protein n=1 Tax=Chromera velia CCMP2878 TaxID=1169474 RepID=A0A0G4HXR3_9ALVE|mmetsp:Transcript_18461/g.37351  ORF Transcript_18461/g.37351 Transcript_18461/m.37351 type:complete len:116 (+) Transcript_18461:180-527(+)|eukprot:Cvel_9326.t1-p1 / transcript=Cvel_9326.t1 / gene=Cvel_9326 / organism=Chromera_velia_CCMP2878 / gene_product=Eukaryotic translation initiation factor 1b, putative / transcript_product=Eukaryotic translation initiation factor 1b, putative / location=Cvel_scaffold535:17128-19148(+) / protein_length=115 / sequence_SO=supercontig / SO=protein_coding / is_pseudo=false
MDDIQNISAGATDPFAGMDEVGGDKAKSASNFVHIRNQMRNGRKSITLIEGLSTEFDFKKLLKAWKKRFNCNGTIVEDEEHGQIINLQGDQRHNIADFLLEEGIVEKENLKVHGA